MICVENPLQKPFQGLSEGFCVGFGLCSGFFGGSGGHLARYLLNNRQSNSFFHTSFLVETSGPLFPDVFFYLLASVSIVSTVSTVSVVSTVSTVSTVITVSTVSSLY